MALKLEQKQLTQPHAHDGKKPHTHQQADNNRALFLVFIITLSFMVVELVTGILTNSLVLIADAGHMTTDSISLGLALVALVIGNRPVNQKHTFGFKRAEVLAAFLNGLLLIFISISITIEAFRRIQEPAEIDSVPMLIVAIVGLFVNLIGIKLLSHNHSENLNIHGAFLHILGDTLGSVGAITAGVIIFLTGEFWVDSVISLGIAILLILGGIRLLRESLHILMEGAPDHLDLKEIEQKVLEIPGVISIHDIHIWTLTSGTHNLSCHVEIDCNEIESCRPSLQMIQAKLKEEFGIEHSTIQIERMESGSDFDCGKCD
ncbi:MAG: cation diffusion facilitator family transporter [Candidatus Hodarchaeales archaeon]|jgi:cobalt-zinc-cadmium efflux system protein